MLPEERRQGPDRWLRGLSGISLFGWSLMFLGTLCVIHAIPQTYKFSLAWGESRPRDWWDPHFLKAGVGLFFGALVVAAVGIIVNARRNRRRHDRYSVSLTLLLVVATVSILAWYLRVDL